MNKTYVFLLFVSAALRFYLTSAKSLCAWLKQRVEISTPLTSWNRVEEGVYLIKLNEQAAKAGVGRGGGGSAYKGDLVHALPMMLHFYRLVIDSFENVALFFVAVDLLNGVLVYLVSSRLIDYLKRVEKRELDAGVYSKSLMMKEEKTEQSASTLTKFWITDQTFPTQYWATCASMFYLLNPLTLASCLSLSTATVHNFILLLWLFFLAEKKVYPALLCLALHANINVYSSVLIAGSISLLIQQHKQNKPKKLEIAGQIAWYLTTFIVFCGALFALNVHLESWDTRFVSCTYSFILRSPDLVPNLGLFWYFLTEMFDHFIAFFTFVFQFNAFIYALPLTLRLHREPVVNLLVQLGYMSVFKSYANVTETALYIALLVPLVGGFLFPYMRNFLVYSAMLLVSLVLAPCMFYLWQGSGGGNANFYFAITLVYSSGQIFLLVDVIYAALKREFIKLNGSQVPRHVETKSLAIFSLE